jgi:hypothetical protein
VQAVICVHDDQVLPGQLGSVLPAPGALRGYNTFLYRPSVTIIIPGMPWVAGGVCCMPGHAMMDALQLHDCGLHTEGSNALWLPAAYLW